LPDPKCPRLKVWSIANTPPQARSSARAQHAPEERAFLWNPHLVQVWEGGGCFSPTRFVSFSNLKPGCASRPRIGYPLKSLRDGGNRPKGFIGIDPDPEQEPSDNVLGRHREE
jgi:hypothetical protein